MNFLDSFKIYIDFLNLGNNAASIIATVTNESSLESATRFRMRENPNMPSGPANPNKSVFPSHKRGEGSVALGGTLNCIWTGA